MRGYSQFCPIAKGAEVFAERWTPLILRELLDGSHRFSELRRGIPLISQSLLAQRLRSLERDGVIEVRRTADGRGAEYHLTPAGEALRPVVEALGGWGHRWTVDRLQDDDFDPAVLMWFLHRQVDVGALPDRRVVVRFEFPEGRHRLWWLILHRPDVDLCLRDEGFEVDLYVSSSVRVLAEAILGRRDLQQEIWTGRVAVDGPRHLVRDFPGWIGASPFAQADGPALTARSPDS
jgi:DNA-binding HxlR family transcriptional regulator